MSTTEERLIAVVTEAQAEVATYVIRQRLAAQRRRQAALRLHWEHGWTYERIGRLLGVSKVAVMHWIRQETADRSAS